MQDPETTLKRIELKIKKLLLAYQEEQERNRKILNEQAKLLVELEEKQAQIDCLVEQNKLLKIKNIVEDSANTKEIKLKINELVREVDQCISFFSNHQM